MLAAESAGNDLAAAMADAAQLIKDAALKAAQDVVDTAAHRGTMADLGLQRLELQQRLAGTFDTGGAQRADYITKTIMPSIQAEINALTAQQDEAKKQGDTTLARQIAEQIGGKQNELLQAQLDAQEQIAANTESLKDFDGSITFEYQGQRFDDDLSDIGVGA